MRVCMVCVLTHVFLPLTPCIRLELALTVHWAHLLQKNRKIKNYKYISFDMLCLDRYMLAAAQLLFG